MSRYRALLLCNWSYKDPGGVLQPLKGPKNDLDLMKAALTHEQYGLFRSEDIEEETNLPWEEIGTRIYEFLRGARRDDSLLIYYSGHGERVAGGLLGLCGINTEHDKVEAQSFPTDRLRSWLDEESQALTKVVVLDCCYAGTMKGNGDEDPEYPDFGIGTAVLSSSGSTGTADAAADNRPSPFTDALASLLVDPEIEGDASGLLDVDAVYRYLEEYTPKLPSRPHRQVQAEGKFPLAKRAPREARGPQAPLKGFPEDLHEDVVDLVFGKTEVTARFAGTEADESRDVGGFDTGRKAAVRRIVQLADAAARLKEAQSDEDWRRSVRKAWDCVGVNLFEYALPEKLRREMSTHLDPTGSRVVKLRLEFEDPDVAKYPWEYLQLPPGDDDDDVGNRRPLALHKGLLIERRAPHGSKAAAGGHRSGQPRTVAVVNCFDSASRAAGETVGGALERSDTAQVVAHLHPEDVSWRRFNEMLDQRPSILLVFAPVRRRQKVLELRFSTRDDPNEGWQRAAEVLRRFEEKNLQFDAIILITFSEAPGQDSARGLLEVATEFAMADVGPVVFACHSPAYRTYFRQSDTECFAALVVEALTRGKPLDQSVYYARSRVVEFASQEEALAIGVPGFYTTARTRAAPRRSAVTMGPVRAKTKPQRADSSD